MEAMEARVVHLRCCHTAVPNGSNPPRISSFARISRVFQSKFPQIHLISVSGPCIYFILKICQFHEFFYSNFWPFFFSPPPRLESSRNSGKRLSYRRPPPASTRWPRRRPQRCRRRTPRCHRRLPRHCSTSSTRRRKRRRPSCRGRRHLLLQPLFNHVALCQFFTSLILRVLA